MIRVLFINPAGYIGGAEKSLIDLVTNLSSERFCLLVVQMSSGSLKDELKDNGIECEEISLPPALLRLSRGGASLPTIMGLPLLAFPTFRRLARLIRSRDIDIVHTNGIKAHLLGIPAALLTRRPLIWHFRDLPEEGLYARCFRLLGRLFPTRIIANSRKVKERLGNMGKIRVVPNAVDPEKFRQQVDRAKIRSELGLSPADLAIGSVGHFAPLKGYEDLIAAVPPVLEQIPRARFRIAGEALYPAYRDYKLRVEELIERKGLKEKVILTGFREDLPAFLSALDLFVLPSRSEGFGRANLEAMAAGLPVVSTTAGGISEVVKNGETGLLVPPGDPAALAAAITRLAEDESLRKKFGESGRRRAASFTIDRMVRGVTDVYNEFVSAKSR